MNFSAQSQPMPGYSDYYITMLCLPFSPSLQMSLWQANNALLKHGHILRPATEPVKMLCYSGSRKLLQLVTKPKLKMRKRHGKRMAMCCKASYSQNIHGKEAAGGREHETPGRVGTRKRPVHYLSAWQGTADFQLCFFQRGW